MAGVEDGTTGGSNIPESTWSVARLNEAIETVIHDADEQFPTYVIGEITEVNPYGFGTFFELRDIDEEAVISCLSWAYAVDGFDYELEEGAAAIVRASVDFYPERGDTQLVVSDYWPVGDSERAKELKTLRSKLSEEGLLDPERKQPLPPYPSRIGVVTSLSGSAREDFTTAVHARSPGVTVKLCGATVQGDNAVPSLVGAIQTLERDAAVDVLVVTRGGGSDADLWCFNEEPVIRTIADCTTPVVVAVGHEDDETLAEAVADHRAMTPTDAGVAVAPKMTAVREGVRALEQRVENAYSRFCVDRLGEYEQRIERANRALRQQAATRHAERQRVADLERRIAGAYDAFVDARLATFDHRIEAALRNVEHAVETEAVTARAARGRVGDLEARIDQAYRSRVEREVDSLEARIDNAYRDVEAEARIEAGTVEARRLRIIVFVLLVLLLLGLAGVALLLL